MAQLTEGTKVGEWLKKMFDRDFCTGVLTLKTSTVQTILPGSMLEVDGDGYIIVANGKEGDVLGITMNEQTIVAAGGEKVLCLVRGPAVIDSDKLSYAADVAWSEVAAALAALDIRPCQGSALAEWLTQTY